MIPTRVHGLLDYLVGLLLIVLGASLYGEQAAAGLVPIILGAATLLYSVGTAYELGLLHVFHMPIHLCLDLLGGAALAASPWVFGFSDVVWAPHLIMGLTEIVVVMLSERTPEPTPPMRHAF